MTHAETRLITQWKHRWEAGDELHEWLKSEATKYGVDLGVIMWAAVHYASCSGGFDENYMPGFIEAMGSNA